VSAAMPDNLSSGVIGASLFVPSPARDLYEAVLDVRSFPRWAPGVRDVEVLARAGESGMVSVWEVSVFGLKKKILTVLKEAESSAFESSAFLRWTYEGPVRGWGQCAIRDWSDGALAEFRTELYPGEPTLRKLMHMPATKSATKSYLRRCLVRLGRAVSGEDARIRVGPPLGLG
jgi:hypothetical protein